MLTGTNGSYLIAENVFSYLKFHKWRKKYYSRLARSESRFEYVIGVIGFEVKNHNTTLTNSSIEPADSNFFFFKSIFYGTMFEMNENYRCNVQMSTHTVGFLFFSIAATRYVARF